ncbi:MAG: hypothetical protein J5I93_07985 [Pirellulaceae bacterium]|nr:hypothetical protein [Pirellulaceae bacterium]
MLVHRGVIQETKVGKANNPMSPNDNGFDPFDPTGLVKSMRDASLDAWSKMMVELVNTQAYAEAQGTMLDAWLSNSAPFRKGTENAINQTLANLNLPSREDITRLAERLTNIEMRLDDLDAKLDEALRGGQKPGKARQSRTGKEES